MKIAVIDDEVYWREQAQRIIRKCYEHAEIDIDTYKSGEEYIESKVCYDISIVDIEMPLTDGFETILKAKEYNKDGIFVILTSHVEMSRKGYLVDAFRYIDKINMEEELIEAMKSSEALMDRNKKINVSVIGEGTRELMLKNIIYVKAEKHYILVNTTHGVIRCSNSLVNMESILDVTWFFRCHNSYIVNIDEIRKVRGSIVYMSDGTDIDVSRRRLLDFKKLYLKRKYECANG